MSDVERECLRTFEATYGEPFSKSWADEWREEFSKAKELDKRCRQLIHRGLRSDPKRNYLVARDALTSWGLAPEWYDNTADPSFDRLVPLARLLAARVRGVRLKPESFIFEGIRQMEKSQLRRGSPLYDLSKEWQFVIYQFEIAFHEGCAFPFLDPEYRPKIPRKTVSNLPVPSELKSREMTYLAARSLAAIALLLFPRSKMGGQDAAFSDQQHQMRKLLRKLGRNSAELAITTEDRRRPRGANSADDYENAGHPATAISETARQWLRDEAERQPFRDHSAPQVWLPWPDGFRDRMRDLAMEKPTVCVWPSG